MYYVTGANGRLGSRIVDGLLQRVPASEIAVSVRDTTAAAGPAARGVRVRAGDFTDPPSLDRAFEGADRVLVVSASIRGPGAAAANHAAIDAAVRAGASHVLYTSHQAAAPDSLFAAQPQHASTEQYLADQPVGWSALRHGFYASTLAAFLPDALRTGELRLPADGPVSWTAHDDLADVDVLALTCPGLLEGVSPPLTAPEALDLAAIASELGELTGRTFRRVVVDDDEWMRDQVEAGVPTAAAEFTLGIFRAARRGEFAVTDPTLESMIGRRPVPARTVLGDLLGWSS